MAVFDCPAGVLAQEVRDVLPDAVKETEDLELVDGDRVSKFLVVNKVSFSVRQVWSSV